MILKIEDCWSLRLRSGIIHTEVVLLISFSVVSDSIRLVSRLWSLLVRTLWLKEVPFKVRRELFESLRLLSYEFVLIYVIVVNESVWQQSLSRSFVSFTVLWWCLLSVPQLGSFTIYGFVFEISTGDLDLCIKLIEVL